MHSGYRRFLSSCLFLSTALVAPSAVTLAATPQDHTRYYDRDHKDYHNWDDNEDRSYRIYLGERHREYHPFAEARHRDQRDYWNWRHAHPDHEGR